MKYLHLIWAALFRSKTRTVLTLLSVIVAFMLFGMLDSVRAAFNAGSNVAGYDRLVVASRLSITQMLPMRLEPQIKAVPGVRKAVHAAWFGGIWLSTENTVMTSKVVPNPSQAAVSLCIRRGRRSATPCSGNSYRAAICKLCRWLSIPW